MSFNVLSLRLSDAAVICVKNALCTVLHFQTKRLENFQERAGEFIPFPCANFFTIPNQKITIRRPMSAPWEQ